MTQQKAYEEQINPGVFIDIDGVVLKGGKPFEWSKEAIQLLWKNEIPFVFVTNGTYCSAPLVNSLSSILELPFTNDHIVVAPSPCHALTQFHDKHVLVCCQDDSIGLIEELGFKSYILMDQLIDTFPDLDYIDHERRKVLLKTPFSPELQARQDAFKPIEAILLLGEPIKWESALQLLIDIIMTNGDPRTKFKYVPSSNLPLIACNKDLTFKGAAALPRFGHGAFLECLEGLYKKLTKNELTYTHLMGKPYLVTYQYAVQQIQRLAKNGQTINKFYMIGDNPEVDIRGASVFKEYMQSSESIPWKQQTLSQSIETASRHFRHQVESILVCTGVYNPQCDMLFHLRNLFDRQKLKQDDCVEEETKPIVILNDQNNNSVETELGLVRSRGSSRKNSIIGMAAAELNTSELKIALSRKNSFISYFDNSQNQPDVTVNDLLDAVYYILDKSHCGQVVF